MKSYSGSIYTGKETALWDPTTYFLSSWDTFSEANKEFSAGNEIKNSCIKTYPVFKMVDEKFEAWIFKSCVAAYSKL